MDTTVILPKRQRGRPSAAAQAQYENDLRRFAEYIKQEAAQLDFRPSSRGWAYMLEGARLINKSEIDTAQDTVNELRRRGWLPLNICAEDTKRAWHGIEQLSDPDTDEAITGILYSIEALSNVYTPYSFWEGKDCYIQMLVEKTDLRELFAPVCRPYRIPIANGGGWADLNLRGQMMERFAEHEREGRVPVLLYCGDHDPAGLLISETIIQNMRDLQDAVKWDPSNVIIDRFGLNYDFITANNLTWIDNLQTSSGGDLSNPKHAHHKYPHVQNYLKKYGARKVEANALVTRAEQGRELCLAAIRKYIPYSNAVRMYEQSLLPARRELHERLAERLKEKYTNRGNTLNNWLVE